MSTYKDFDNVNFKRNPGSTMVSSSAIVNKVENIFKKNPTITISATTTKLRISSSTMCQIKILKLTSMLLQKNYTKVCTIKKNHAKYVCKKIYDSLSGKVAVMDDEKYIIMEPSQTSG